MDFNQNLAISDYKTIAVINESHKIYLVQHQETNRVYVKKILDVYNIAIYKNLYENPIPGTPRILAFCEQNHELIIIEEYISGISLQELIDSSRLTESDICDYLTDLCKILNQLHSQCPPVIHRDLKPSNIMITNYNHAVLLDFNAAKIYSDISKEDTVLLGTQGYAAPEQYGFGSSSPQTDIYALGICLKEMVSSLKEPCNLFDVMISKCTQLDPKDRYKNVMEIKDTILLLNPPHNITRHNHNMHKLLPPGYRTKTPWKMIVSSIVYFFIFWLCLTLEISELTGSALWFERIFLLIILLFVIFGCFNYMNIQKLLPLCQSKNRLLHYLGIFLLDFLLVALSVTILLIMESVFWGLN